MIDQTKRRWFNVKETASSLGLSVAGVRKMIARGEIPAVHVGRTVRVDGRKLECQLEGQTLALEKTIRNSPAPRHEGIERKHREISELKQFLFSRR